MYFALGASWPLSAQTSEEARPTATESGKAKHAEGSYSYDQAPDRDVPSNDQLLKLYREQNARLKAENAQLKAEIAKLKAKQ